MDELRKQNVDLRGRLIGGSCIVAEEEGRSEVKAQDQESRMKFTREVRILEVEVLEEMHRRNLLKEMLSQEHASEHEEMQLAKWQSLIIDSGIRGFSQPAGRAIDVDPPALLEGQVTPENRRRKSEARQPEVPSITTRVTGLAMKLVESFSPAPKKARATEAEDGQQPTDSEEKHDKGKDRDRDGRKIDLDQDDHSNSMAEQPVERLGEWRVGQPVMAKEERKGEFKEAEIVKIDKRLGVQLKWESTGVEKWLRN
eukprot:gene11274-biopygen6890